MTISKRAIACATLAMATGLIIAAEAHATIYVLNLNGAVGSTVYGSFTSGGKAYQTANLDLGFGSYAPITLMNGDELQVTIGLDSQFTIPGINSNGYEFIGINFRDSGGADPAVLPSPPNPEVSTGTMTFSGGVAAPSGPVSTNCGNCTTDLYGAGGPMASFTFNNLSGDITIQSLATPYTINDVTLSYQISNAVPEPAAWTLMLIGFGGLGVTMRRRRMASGWA
jgi:hypothetical protein